MQWNLISNSHSLFFKIKVRILIDYASEKIKLFSVPLWMPLLHKTRNPCFFPCDFAPSPLYQESCSLQSFEIIFLQFSTSVFVSSSNLYHAFSVGCCDLPSSLQNDLPLFCDISGKSVSLFERVLLLWALCAHSGGERHLIISCRGKSLPDWCPHTDLLLPLGMRPASLTWHSPEAQGAPGCLCLLFDWFCFTALSHFTLRVGTEGEKQGQKLSKREDMNLNGVNTATGLDGQSWNKPSRDSRWGTGPDRQHLVGGESFWVLTASLLQCLIQRGDWRLCRGGEGENRAEREWGPGIQNRAAYWKVSIHFLAKRSSGPLWMALENTSG